MIAHDWRECRPALLSLAPSVGAQQAWDAIELMWLGLDEQNRRLFHEFCCTNQRSLAHLEAMERISTTIQEFTAKEIT